jgi:hypothetical protein
MTSTRVRLIVLGVNPFQMSDALNSRMGTTYGDYPWVSALVMGNLMGRRFGWVVDGFFLGGLSSGGITAACLQTITEGTPESRGPGKTRVMFEFRQADDLFHGLKTVKGLLHLVPSRTPRGSGYGVLCTCGLYYMLFLLYV